MAAIDNSACQLKSVAFLCPYQLIKEISFGTAMSLIAISARFSNFIGIVPHWH